MARILSAIMLTAVVCTSFAEQADQSRYVTGMVLVSGTVPSCPIFVSKVQALSPAARSGIQLGDQLITIDGTRIDDLLHAAQRLTSNAPVPVIVELIRGDKKISVMLKREDRITVLKANGWKMFQGKIVPVEATDVEAEYILSTMKELEQQNFSVAFPGHYPTNKALYYPGFEAFIWSNQKKVTVGGIEDGPARRAGVRWGDEIVQVNRLDPKGKTKSEIESMLAGPDQFPCS